MNTDKIFTYGLAELFGLFIFIFAVALYSRRDYYRKVFLNIHDDNPVIMLAALCELFIGIILIGLHGMEIFKFKLGITIICWLVFINSLFWLMMPEKMLATTKKIIKGRGLYLLVSLSIIFGLMLFFRSSELVIINYG